jgi:hypothetical protein
MEKRQLISTSRGERSDAFQAQFCITGEFNIQKFSDFCNGIAATTHFILLSLLLFI